MHILYFAVWKEQQPRKNVPNVSFGLQIIEIMVPTISRYVGWGFIQGQIMGRVYFEKFLLSILDKDSRKS